MSVGENETVTVVPVRVLGVVVQEAAPEDVSNGCHALGELGMCTQKMLPVIRDVPWGHLGVQSLPWRQHQPQEYGWCWGC